MSLQSRYQVYITTVMICISYGFVMHANAEERGNCHTGSSSRGLWDHRNLFAWGLSVDSRSRSPEERARMLEGLGLKKVAYNWDSKDIATFDEQIEAFKRHGVEIIAWSITDVDDASQVVDWTTRKIQGLDVLAGLSKAAPNAMTVAGMLDMFSRHHIAPQLWLIRRMRSSRPVLESSRPFSEWTDAEKDRGFRNLLGYDPVATPQEHALRVEQEATRIKALAELTAPYGVKVGLYKHGGWIGISDNQMSIVERLKELGVTNVGIVYQFIHAHDEVDDTRDFSAVWKKLHPYVLAVNITGVHEGRTTIYPILYPSQGELELRMMSTIQDSGWTGPIGLSPEKGGDAEINLRNNIVGVDWIALELRCKSSAGPPPFSR